MTYSQTMITNIYNIIKDKLFFSNISGEQCIVVEQVPEISNDGKVYFDGMTLIDNVEGIEDDIQQVTSITYDSTSVNLEDYYTENGAFEEGKEEQFIAALKRLMPSSIQTVEHLCGMLQAMATKGFGDHIVVIVHKGYPWPVNKVQLSEDGKEIILSYDHEDDEANEDEYIEYLTVYDLLDILDEDITDNSDNTTKIATVIIDDRGETNSIIKHQLSGEWRADSLEPLYDEVILLF